ncbi:MAG: hypothetical protein JSR77_01680 [Planctomycetes bacterium]|nr:hypothetical protein [Planctomycetota bacterium]
MSVASPTCTLPEASRRPRSASPHPVIPSFWEFTIAAAIMVSDLARQEFKSLGVGLQIFTCPCLHDAFRSAMVAPDDFERVALQAIGAPEVFRQLQLHIEILLASPDGAVDRHAVSDVRRGAAALARAWLPQLLIHAARQIQQGKPLWCISKCLRTWITLAELDLPTPGLAIGASLP